jgi:O-antigen/teichoic acid export membrane protein
MMFNTTATYGRSLLNLGLGLFSSRWVLNALGHTDFGLFSVVGSLIIFMTFFNTVMATSSARHFAYAIGQGNLEEVAKWFNSSLCIHLILPTILILLGWPVAEFAVRNFLTIPPERLEICVQILRISLIGAFVSMASIPFVAMFNAKQRITELAFWASLQSVMIFVLAWGVIRIPFDKLLFYAFGMVAIQITIKIIQIARAFKIFQECRLRLQCAFNVKRLKELLGFAVWNFIGNAGAMLRNQGAAILLNMYYGPILNSAFGIARQVSTQTNQLSAAMMTAFAPEIISREGRGERKRMISLAHRSCKIGTILVMIFAIPLIIEMDYVLRLWLISPPVSTAIFCQFILASFLLDRLTVGYALAVSAHGKIAAYQASVGGILILTLPLGWFLFWLGYPPASLGWAMVITSGMASIGRVFWLQRLLGEPIYQWWSRVGFPCFIVATFAYLLSMIPAILLPESFLRFSFTTGIAVSVIALSTWFVALDADERLFFKAAGNRLISKFGFFKV